MQLDRYRSSKVLAYRLQCHVDLSQFNWTLSIAKLTLYFKVYNQTFFLLIEKPNPFPNRYVTRNTPYSAPFVPKIRCLVSS